MKNIGVIAGVFDPIHLGHINFIERSIRDFQLDEFFILIEKNSQHKKIFVSFADRENMVYLATESNKKIKIYKNNSKSFPISTCLPKIKIQNPKSKIYLLVGSDVAEHINTWEGADQLLSGVELIVARRGSATRLSSVTSGTVRSQLSNGETADDLEPKVADYIQKNGLYL